MKSGLSMTSRAEVTTRYARSFRAADKRTKGRILDEVVSVTGWSRDNARRRLTSAAQSPPGAGRSVTTRPRKQRATKFSYDALKVLQRVWAASGGQCGKYLAASMRMQLDGLERHGELVDGVGRYSMAVREELLAMSAASIDRYLRPAKATDQIRGVSTTKPSPLLRSSIKIRKAGDEVEAEPGFFEGDTVAHCGPTLKGEFARTLNLTCVHTGWVFTRTMRNNAHAHVLALCRWACRKSLSPSRVWISTTAPSSSTRPSSPGPVSGTSTSPVPGRTRRTTRPRSSPRTTTWSASTASTTAMTPARNATR